MLVLVLGHTITELVNVRILNEINEIDFYVRLDGQIGSYGNYYNPYQSSGGFYGGGYGGYNRPGYSSNYYPSSYGGNYFGGGGYYWGAGQKNTINIFLLTLSSLLTFIIYLITN